MNLILEGREKMKRIPIYTLIILIILTLTPLTTVMAQENITIELWDILTQSEALRPAIKDAIKRFEADNSNVNIKHIPTSNDNYKTKLRTAMSANNAPDIFMTWGSTGLEKYVDQNKVYSIEGVDWTKHFPTTALSIGKFNEQQYGIPVQGVTPAILWYRTDMFEKYGLEAPETYKDLLKVVKTLTDNDIIPFTLANKNKWTGSEYYMYFVDRIGGPEALQKAISREGAFNDEPFIEAGRKIQELVKMGAFPDGVNGLDENAGQSRMLLYTDKAAMYLIGSWSYGIMKQETPKILDKLEMINFPAIEDGKGDPSNLIGAPAQNFYSVSQNSEYKDVSVKFLKYLADKEMGRAVIESGNMPVVKGVAKEIEDPYLKEIYSMGQKASHIQLWYDQTLPLELAQVHLNTTQALFGMEMTPEEAANQMEAAAKEYYGE